MPIDFHEKYFKPPMDERLLIYPKPRQDLFLNLVENYKIFCSDLTMLYAGLNYDSSLKIDYLVIFHRILENQDVILWDCPFLYSNRTIPSYRYAVKNQLHKEFFQECKFHLCQIVQYRFIEFLESGLCNELSVKSDNPRFWKDPRNIGDLMKGMSELSLQYRPVGYRNPNRPKEYF